jgi:diaminopimelate decarboxylase
MQGESTFFRQYQAFNVPPSTINEFTTSCIRLPSKRKLMSLNFGYKKQQLVFWRTLTTPLLYRATTPFYLLSVVPIQDALHQLDKEFMGLPLKSWLSFKTQPVRPLIQWWQKEGRSVEIVSEFELLAVLKEGFPAERILVNGPAKQRWLSGHNVRNLCVNFDSLAEAKALLAQAKKLNWRVGIRVNTSEEFDTKTPDVPTQFGFTLSEATGVLKKLRREKLRLEMVHFHLRTNIDSSTSYEKALQEVASVCAASGFQPRIVNSGGGYPAPHILTPEGQRVDANFRFSEMRRVYERLLQHFPKAEEIWLENGRWLTARSGILVLKILDVKRRGNIRSLICDGGRTMNAILAASEQHEIISIPNRSGSLAQTIVNGPTCMASDFLANRPLPRSLRAGDHLLWLDAGAYHLPWETRFSHGVPAVLWHDGKRTTLAREAETFPRWWGQWK